MQLIETGKKLLVAPANLEEIQGKSAAGLALSGVGFGVATGFGSGVGTVVGVGVGIGSC